MKIALTAGGVSRTFTAAHEASRLRLRDESGEETILEIMSAAGGSLVLGLAGRRLEVAGTALGAQRQLWVNGRNVTMNREVAGAPHRAETDGDLGAAIPSVVLEILVAEGDLVAEGQRLILLESMKMVVPITARRPGVVRAILCREGEAVQPGVALLEIDSNASEPPAAS